LILGTVAAVVVGFLLWRQERSARLGEAGRLKLMRLVSDGERVVAASKSATQRQNGIAAAVLGLHAWPKECLQTIKAECPRFWGHFADLGEVRDDATEEYVERLIQRIRNVLDVSSRS